MINSLKKTFSIIKKNKSKVFLLFFLQVIFFIILTFIFLYTMTPAMQHAKSAIDYYDTINISKDSGMFGYLGEDPLSIYENYTKMMIYIRFMLLFSILAIIIINGLSWTLTDNLINKKNLKQSFNYFTKFGIITLVFLTLFYLIIFNTLKSSLAALETSLMPLIGVIILFLILLYFLFISFSIIRKDIIELTFHIGIFKFPKIILIYIINTLIITLFSYLLYLTIEANIILLIITVILFVFSFVFTRLFLIISINSLTKKN